MLNKLRAKNRIQSGDSYKVGLVTSIVSININKRKCIYCEQLAADVFCSKSHCLGVVLAASFGLDSNIVLS